MSIIQVMLGRVLLFLFKALLAVIVSIMVIGGVGSILFGHEGSCPGGASSQMGQCP
jgi:hypothetical protein